MSPRDWLYADHSRFARTSNKLGVLKCSSPLLPHIDQIKAASPALNHSYTILLAPRVTSICATTLEDQGVLGSVDIHELPMSLIPLERDVLSMELGAQAYKDIYLVREMRITNCHSLTSVVVVGQQLRRYL